MIEDSATYACRVAHAAFIKFINNRFDIPITLKFSLKVSKNTINISQKHVCIFISIKLLDPPATITSPNGNVDRPPKDFPCS